MNILHKYKFSWIQAQLRFVRWCFIAQMSVYFSRQNIHVTTTHYTSTVYGKFGNFNRFSTPFRALILTFSLTKKTEKVFLKPADHVVIFVLYLRKLAEI